AREDVDEIAESQDADGGAPCSEVVTEERENGPGEDNEHERDGNRSEQDEASCTNRHPLHAGSVALHMQSSDSRAQRVRRCDHHEADEGSHPESDVEDAGILRGCERSEHDRADLRTSYADDVEYHERQGAPAPSVALVERGHNPGGHRKTSA